MTIFDHSLLPILVDVSKWKYGDAIVPLYYAEVSQKSHVILRIFAREVANGRNYSSKSLVTSPWPREDEFRRARLKKAASGEGGRPTRGLKDVKLGSSAYHDRRTAACRACRREVRW